MTSGFEIRLAAVEDVPTILTFICDLAAYERLSHEVVATDELLRETLFGKRRVAEVLLGFKDGEAVGFAVFFHSFSTFLGLPGIWLEDLFVKPEHRGKGYGKALLRRVAQLAKERGCGRLEWSVLDWNEPAIHFYKRLKAVPKDEWTTYRVTGEALNKLAGEENG